MLSTLGFILKHPLNRPAPIGGLYRFARWQMLSRQGGDVTTPWIEGSVLVARHGMHGATGNIYCGLHEHADMAFVLHALRPDDLFLDIGSNIGSYTILASKVCGARTIAFEPDPGTAAALRRNIAANGIEGLVTVEQTALGDEEGTISFTVGKDAMNHVATAQDTVVQTVGVCRLDSLGPFSPTVIKMDAEGFEDQIVRGATQTFAAPSLLAVLTEKSGGEVSEFLERHGFQLSGYDPFTRTLGVAGSQTGNALFVRDAAKVQALVKAAPYRKVNAARI